MPGVPMAFVEDFADPIPQQTVFLPSIRRRRVSLEPRRWFDGYQLLTYHA
jgi:hypothetical protein